VISNWRRSRPAEQPAINYPDRRAYSQTTLYHRIDLIQLINGSQIWQSLITHCQFVSFILSFHWFHVLIRITKQANSVY